MFIFKNIFKLAEIINLNFLIFESMVIIFFKQNVFVSWEKKKIKIITNIINVVYKYKVQDPVKLLLVLQHIKFSRKKLKLLYVH